MRRLMAQYSVEPPEQPSDNEEIAKAHAAIAYLGGQVDALLERLVLLEARTPAAETILASTAGA